MAGDAAVLAFLVAKGLDVFGRIFLCADDCPQHSAKESCRAYVERQPDGERNRVAWGPGAEMKYVSKQPGKCGRDNRSQPNEKALHGEAPCALLLGEQVSYEGPKGFHADIDRRIQDPEQARRHPQRRAPRHQDQRAGAKNCPGQEIGSASPQPVPRVVTGMADDWLYQEPGQGSSEPENRNLVSARSQVFVNRAHVGHLQAPSKLDAEEAEAHVPYLPEAPGWFLHEMTQ